jgi:hypothetical protein
MKEPTLERPATTTGVEKEELASPPVKDVDARSEDQVSRNVNRKRHSSMQ